MVVEILISRYVVAIIAYDKKKNKNFQKQDKEKASEQLILPISQNTTITNTMTEQEDRPIDKRSQE